MNVTGGGDDEGGGGGGGDGGGDDEAESFGGVGKRCWSSRDSRTTFGVRRFFFAPLFVVVDAAVAVVGVGCGVLFSAISLSLSLTRVLLLSLARFPLRVCATSDAKKNRHDAVR